MIQQIWNFLSTGNAERVTGIVLAFLVVATLAGVLFYHMSVIILKFFSTILGYFDFGKFKPKDRIVEIPKYVEPPVNKEIEKYLNILKKIADDYNNSVKL